ncbi:NADH-quinone oxidoreductase subunit NuoK [Wolbachia endosymbiont of Dipetalonema caudispina]|uniref:NADH-quinone oxidoreductase subunit NuoK n=1 Tax=Wolbachia endosymbiont of Dipetalonema caudispina TaxID=1812112 RepID=UPI00158CB77F|nr:NADH-quinone oxidoreductase subunit NuoK [Wolbachia endosymbiont of Dipetalonema caudispina]MCV3769247.1 NADH-quinone oxidoreductase subunit NuoK [Wolbachia pipientis]QKX00931.1 NADH-quinone oxidoreductase subunit NuoK [Wolbachia endosymbiont of Dipetalonema caudispina]
MEIRLDHFLVVAAVLFTIGVCGILFNRKSIINVLLSIEILLLAININLVAFSAFMNDIIGQIFVIFVLTVAAAKSGIGLAILVMYYRNRGNIDIERVNLMKE